MRRPLFTFGYGMSVALLLVCALYALSHTWRTSVIDVFAYPGEFVGLPPLLRYVALAFGALNLPVVLLANFAVPRLPLAPGTRPWAWGLLCLAGAALWWWMLATIALRRSRR
jgi:hypothetical protein